MTSNRSQTKSRIRSIVWDWVRDHGWEDRDDYTLRLVDALVEAEPENSPINDGFKKTIDGIATNFFTMNRLSKGLFAERFLRDIGGRVNQIIQTCRSPLLATDLFPEITLTSVDVRETRSLADQPERFLQDSLRKVLRGRGATPVPVRKADTAQEVADIEFLRIPVGGQVRSLAIVVKGYKSVRGKTLTWEDVAHQITKANRGSPDYIILVSAKEPADGVLTSLQEYSLSVGKPGFVIFVTPSDLVCILRSNRIL